jgi:hypothetical protein
MRGNCENSKRGSETIKNWRENLHNLSPVRRWNAWQQKSTTQIHNNYQQQPSLLITIQKDIVLTHTISPIMMLSPGLRNCVSKLQQQQQHTLRSSRFNNNTAAVVVRFNSSSNNSKESLTTEKAIIRHRLLQERLKDTEQVAGVSDAAASTGATSAAKPGVSTTTTKTSPSLLTYSLLRNTTNNKSQQQERLRLVKGFMACCFVLTLAYQNVMNAKIARRKALELQALGELYQANLAALTSLVDDDAVRRVSKECVQTTMATTTAANNNNSSSSSWWSPWKRARNDDSQQQELDRAAAIAHDQVHALLCNYLQSRVNAHKTDPQLVRLVLENGDELALVESDRRLKELSALGDTDSE